MTELVAASVDSANTPQVSERRQALFREPVARRVQRVVLGTAWALQPSRIGSLPGLARLWLADLVGGGRELPDPRRPANAMGACGIVHDPTPERLVEAYGRGLFPLAHFGPLKWMSPPDRCILTFADLHIERTLRRLMRQGRYTVTFDRAFDEVMVACAGRRRGRWPLTWITPRVMRLYAELHDAGHAHSFEVWNRAGALVGGGYGVAVGGAFFGESQFSHERNTSKLGLTVLHWHLARWGFLLDDGKWPTPTTCAMGFRCVPREEFLALLGDAIARPGRTGRWVAETGPETVAHWRPEDCAHARRSSQAA
jgi:leucyl/phenylalanyl-tRNA--protein transferase